MDDFLVAVEREVVAVGDDLGLGDKEGLVRALAFPLFTLQSPISDPQSLPSSQNVWQVGLVGLRGALVVEREAVLFHVVEPDLVGAAGVGLGEEEDGGGDPGVGLEDAGGHGDDGIEFLILDEELADLLVGIGRAKEHAVRHDDGGAATGLENAQEERHEEEFGFLGLDDALEVLGGGFVIETARERRIGEDEGVFFRVVLIVFGQRVLVADVRVFHAVEEHVHAADAEHGGIEVVAVEGGLVEAAAGDGILVDGIAVVGVEIFGGGDEETGGAERGIADLVLGRGSGHVHHQLDDVARAAELAVLPGAGDFSQHIFVEVALGVAVGHVDGIELVHDVRQHARRGHHEGGVLHVVAVGAAALAAGSLADGLDEGKGVIAHRGEHFIRREFLEARPAELVLLRREDGFLDGFLEAVRLVFLEGVDLVQALDEEQVGELLDDGERIGDAAGPQGVPDAVDFGFDFASDHWIDHF